MAENQLREAYALMKQGDKKGAARLVQDVLREDRNNHQAWWLFSHLLDDEEKIVKSLEKVVALNPEHAGARKKLASMRPEYAHLAQPDSVKAKPKTEQSDAYWSKLDNEYTIREQAYTKHIADTSHVTMRLKVMLGVLPIFFFIVIVAYFQNQQSLPDDNGDTPQDIATRFYTALYQEDSDTLYALTCPARYERIDEKVAEFTGWTPEEVSVDASQTTYELVDFSEDLAYITIHGSITADFDGTVVSIDWDADAEANGADAYGIFFKRTNGIWQVCNPYYIPDLEYED